MSDAVPQNLPEKVLLATFIEALEELQKGATQTHPDPRSLQQNFLKTQQLYQQQLLPTLMDSPTAADLVTYHAEMNRALRLLGVDVAFLQSAKNPMTQQKRQVQMQQRLKTLLEFSQGLQAELPDLPQPVDEETQ